MIDMMELREKVNKDLEYYGDLNERLLTAIQARKPGTVTPSRAIHERTYYIYQYLTWLSRTMEPIEAKGRPL